MGKITAIQGIRQRRVKIFLNDRPAFSLGVDTSEGLRVGQELPDERIEALDKADRLQSCNEAALRLLAYRPRSESELRARLKRRGFDDDTIGETVTRLKEQNAINDMSFSQFWKENRETFNPRSRWLTRLELRQKGVNADVIERVVSTIDDGDSAYRAALSRARKMSLVNYEEFYRRLSGYLKRRGFGYNIVNQTVKKIWQELGGRVRDSD